MIVTYISVPGLVSPVKLGSGYPLYKWRLISAMAQAVGTSTLVSNVTITLNRNNVGTNILDVVTSSTALNVTQFLEKANTGSIANQLIAAELYGDGLVLGPNDNIEVSWVNNGTVVWQLIFEEFI